MLAIINIVMIEMMPYLPLLQGLNLNVTKLVDLIFCVEMKHFRSKDPD